MLRYFVAGNFWLAGAVLLTLGPDGRAAGYVSFSARRLGPIEPSIIHLGLIGLCFAAAAVNFRLAWRTRRDRAARADQGDAHRADANW